MVTLFNLVIGILLGFVSFPVKFLQKLGIWAVFLNFHFEMVQNLLFLFSIRHELLAILNIFLCLFGYNIVNEMFVQVQSGNLPFCIFQNCVGLEFGG